MIGMLVPRFMLSIRERTGSPLQFGTPKLQKYIVVVSHNDTYSVGQLID